MADQLQLLKLKSPDEPYCALLGPVAHSGLASTMAFLLSRAGYDVALLGTDTAALDAMERTMKAESPSRSVWTFPYQVGSPSSASLSLISLEECVVRALKKMTGFSLVFVDADLFGHALAHMEFCSDSSFLDRFFQRHLSHPMQMARAAIAALPNPKRSHVVFPIPLSALVHTGASGSAHVSCAAGGLRQFAMGLLEDVRSQGVKVTALMINAVNTTTFLPSTSRARAAVGAPHHPPSHAHASAGGTGATHFPSDVELLAPIVSATPSDCVQPQDVLRAVQYLRSVRPSAVAKDIILQSHRQPVASLRAVINPLPESKGLRMNMSLADGATLEGLSPGSRPWAVLTGASEGIGRAMALRLASMGFDLVLIARNRERLESAAAECAKLSVRTSTHALDVTDLAELRQAMRAAVGQWGTRRLQVLVCNAGINMRKGVLQADAHLWDRVHAVNFKANEHLTTWVAPLLAANRTGSIVYINSLVAASLSNAQAGVEAYYSSKWALAGFANCVYEDVREFGVQISSLCVGLVNNRLGTRPGPAPYGGDLLQNEDVADALEYVVTQQASATACPTHIYLHTQPAVLLPIHRFAQALRDRCVQQQQTPLISSKL